MFWERNYFLEGTLMGTLLRHHAVRGAISGMGVICLVAALAELWDLRPRRLRPGEASNSRAAEPSLEGTSDR